MNGIGHSAVMSEGRIMKFIKILLCVLFAANFVFATGCSQNDGNNIDNCLIMIPTEFNSSYCSYRVSKNNIHVQYVADKSLYSGSDTDEKIKITKEEYQTLNELYKSVTTFETTDEDIPYDGLPEVYFFFNGEIPDRDTYSAEETASFALGYAEDENLNQLMDKLIEITGIYND